MYILSEWDNRQNFPFWSDSNANMTRQIHTVHFEKLNFWTEILGNHTIKPFIVEGNLKEEGYLKFLMPSINHIIELDSLLQNEVDCQQDGVLPLRLVQYSSSSIMTF